MSKEALDILVVDDNPVLVSVLSEIFRECGHHVRLASDGFFALSEISKTVPDILLSDLCMPRMSGYELLSVVRRRFPSIRVIAMSGASSGNAIPSGIAADAFYAKGASSVAHLIQMLSSVWREEVHSLRSATPVWISEATTDQSDASVMLVSCPECLRAFARCRSSFQLLPWKDSCPHCRTMFEITCVRQSHGMDGTPISVDRHAAQIHDAAISARSNTITSAARMHQR